MSRADPFTAWHTFAIFEIFYLISVRVSIEFTVSQSVNQSIEIINVSTISMRDRLLVLSCQYST